MAEILIETKNLTRTYTAKSGLEIFALKKVELQIPKAALVSIMGPSGAGKSTLFNLLGLLDKPDSGSIFYQGIDVLKMSADEKSRFRNSYLGFVFQHFHLITNLTVMENVILPFILTNQRVTAERRKKAGELLERFDLGAMKDKYPNELSGGERQRVAIARAVVNNPEVILADEPTGSLDSKSTEKVYQSLIELNQRDGKTIIYITHNLDLARQAGQIIYLEDGEVKDGETRKN